MIEQKPVIRSRKFNLAVQARNLQLNYSQMAKSSEYPFIKNNTLIWRGIFAPTSYSIDYTVEIRFKQHNYCPSVKLISPLLATKDGKWPPHIYMKDKSLCIYHKSDWRRDYLISEENLLGWISKWLLAYEVWQCTGNWRTDAINHYFTPIRHPDFMDEPYARVKNLK